MLNTKVKKNKKLVGLFLLGVILSNYPIISLFNLKRMFFGFPLLYLYMFSVWALLISLIILLTTSGSYKRKIDPSKKPG
jgi:hypothetical protein